MSRSRDYCFTINNYDEEDEDNVFALSVEADFRYVVCGKEVGEAGTAHLQGFVCFSNKKSLNQMQALLPGGHFEAKRGTFKQASDYCKKEGNFYEHGELPMDAAAKGLKGKEAFEQMMADTIDLVRQGNYLEINPGMTSHIKACEYRVLKEQQQSRNLETIQGDMPHEWFYGPARTGKSRTARDMYPDAYLKMCNKWWDGYKGEDVVIIEDFDRSHHVLLHHLKIWSDRYAYPSEIKGGTLKIRPKKIIVTSNWHPNEIWEHANDAEPIIERFRLRHFPRNQLFPLARVNAIHPAFNPPADNI